MEAVFTVDVVIPVYKPDEKFRRLIARLLKQSCPIHQIVLVITGGPLKHEEAIRKQFAFYKIPAEIIHISPEEFDHGGTRHMAAERCTGDLILFITQDAVPADPDLVKNLSRYFQDGRVAAAYARQLPHKDCRLIERYTRSFNYPEESRIKTKEDLNELGIKTFFCSNVCAAYRRAVYLKMGGFPRNAIFNEDMIFAGRLIQAGYAIAYGADAKVIHSHSYNLRQQLSRNFDLAVSQKQFPEVFGSVKSETEGIRLVKQTAGWLAGRKRWDQIPVLVLQSGAKFIGYRLGKMYDRLPGRLVMALTMNRRYWERLAAGGEDVLVSVCVPAYNSGSYIQRTMESVLNQTHRNLELVVVDDCSSDDTVQKVEELAAGDSRVRLVKNPRNLGMAGNWNECIRQAGGEYVKLLCADDILYPESIEKELAPFLTHQDLQLSMSDTALINIDGQRVGAFCRWPKKGLMDGRKLAKISLLFNNFFGAPCNNLFRRVSALEAGGFDSGFSYILDFDFWVRMACMGKVYITHEKLNAFRIRRDSNTGDVMGEGDRGAEYIREHEKLVEKYRGEPLKLTKGQVRFSIWWRKTRSRLIHIYLKIFTK